MDEEKCENCDKWWKPEEVYQVGNLYCPGCEDWMDYCKMDQKEERAEEGR